MLFFKVILNGTADMKHTTNFIIYLNDEGKVHCAKCKMTGRFVKRVIAQNEYDIEYVYKVTFKGFISFMFTVFFILLSFKQVKKTAKKLDQLNSEALKALQQNNFGKINALQSEAYSLKFKA